MDTVKLMRQMRECVHLQEDAEAQGFKFHEGEEEALWGKVEEELHEVVEATFEHDKARLTDEFGDLLFMVIRAARFFDVDLGEALLQANVKFSLRVAHVCVLVKEEGKSLNGMPLNEIAPYWQRAKEWAERSTGK